MDCTQSYIIAATCTTKLNNTYYQRCSDKLNYDYPSHRFTIIFLKVSPPPLLVDKLICIENFTIIWISLVDVRPLSIIHVESFHSVNISKYNLYRIHSLCSPLYAYIFIMKRSTYFRKYLPSGLLSGYVSGNVWGYSSTMTYCGPSSVKLHVLCETLTPCYPNTITLVEVHNGVGVPKFIKKMVQSYGVGK